MTGATPTPERASDLRARVHLRPRTDADLPELVTILAEQQPYTGYPETWADEPDPLPLIKRPTELATWVANVDDRLVGHISITTADTPAHDDFHAPEVLWTDALNLPLDQLGLVSALFVANSVRGKGVGACCSTRPSQPSKPAAWRPSSKWSTVRAELSSSTVTAAGRSWANAVRRGPLAWNTAS